ncbi:protein translocase subunit SecF [Paenibacillus hemerocallicola]|uniref:Protein-export membrane protein SecF n=1 Tax=Paenibacillus hemerocallicola TaxID=1172614 RepID=A0A5C4TFA2_9BACL|nr:protein translocase subunit SecF [Paenibacillus hemerocallicola]TNJ67635.1 protein translocase subunit SecF [Paenibacillus hemerocallicola]
MSYKNRYDFIKNRNIFFIASAAVTVIGIIMVLLFNMHYGVDFKSGTSLDLALGKTTDKAQVEQIFADAKLSPVILTIGGANSDRVSARYDEVLTEEQVKVLTTTFAGVFGEQVSSEVNTVSPDMANEMKNKAMIAVGVASLAVALYVTIRFEWRFALSAIVTILYDAFFVIAIFSIFRLEVDLPFVAAVLTTIGYSINDKIVILDRIRENLRFAKLKTDADLAELVNTSIWQTMGRSINTVITVLIAALCLYLFGSESIKLFALAKMIGLVSGVYSSICLATPMWYLLKRTSLKSVKAAPAKANP